MAKYRQFYEKNTGSKIDEGFEIHHLDGNRKNNSMQNLVAIPKELHEKYHNVEQQYMNFILALNDSRYFIPRYTNIGLKHIERYTILRSEVYQYELRRDSLCHNNGCPVEYKDEGCENIVNIFNRRRK